MNEGIDEALFPMDLSLVFLPFTSLFMILSVPPVSLKSLPQFHSTLPSYQVTVLQKAVCTVAGSVLRVC